MIVLCDSAIANKIRIELWKFSVFTNLDMLRSVWSTNFFYKFKTSCTMSCTLWPSQHKSQTIDGNLQMRYFKANKNCLFLLIFSGLVKLNFSWSKINSYHAMLNVKKWNDLQS
jgi:hypothetical protein